MLPFYGEPREILASNLASGFVIFNAPYFAQSSKRAPGS
jgi:hypothetical protein